MEEEMMQPTMRSTLELLQDEVYHKQIVREAMGEKISYRTALAPNDSMNSAIDLKSNSLRDQPNMF